jgi:antitoxin FitA
MGQVLIRNLDDDVVARLKQRAELAGVSLEQFLRDLLSGAAPLTADEKVAISRRLRAAFASDDWDTSGAIRWGRDDEFFEIEKKFDTA